MDELEQKDSRTITEWSSNSRYITALFCWTIGLLNVFHGPQLFLRGGIMDFVICYIPLIVILGIPLTFMELAISQYSSSSVKAWNLCPLFRGIGYSKALLIIVVQVYYNVLNSYVLLYTVSAFSKTVSWEECDSSWANSTCYGIKDNVTVKDKEGRQSSTEQFWYNKVLQFKGDSHKIEWVHWELVIYLCAIMFIVFLANCRGTKSLDRFLPLIFVTSSLETAVLFFVTAVAPGAIQGMNHLFKLDIHTDVLPPWKNNSVVMGAFQDILYSTGIGPGGFSSLGAQSSFRKPVHAFAILVNLFNVGATFVYTIIIYNFYGILSHHTNVEIADLVQEKRFSSNVFTVIPSALVYLPGASQIWIFLFYSSVFLKGLGSSVLMVATILQMLYEFKPNLMKKSVICAFTCTLLICLSGFVLHTNVGVIISSYLNDLTYTMLLPVINSVQILVVIYVYGIGNFSDDIYFMLGFKPSVYWHFSLVISSVLLPTLTVISIVQFYGEYQYYKYNFIKVLEQCVIPLILIWIPFMAMVRIIKKGLWRNLLQPSNDWGPHDNILKKSRRMFTDDNLISEYVYEKNLLKNRLTKYEDNYNVQ